MAVVATVAMVATRTVQALLWCTYLKVLLPNRLPANHPARFQPWNRADELQGTICGELAVWAIYFSLKIVAYIIKKLLWMVPFSISQQFDAMSCIETALQLFTALFTAFFLFPHFHGVFWSSICYLHDYNDAYFWVFGTTRGKQRLIRGLLRINRIFVATYLHLIVAAAMLDTMGGLGLVRTDVLEFYINEPIRYYSIPRFYFKADGDTSHTVRPDPSLHFAETILLLVVPCWLLIVRAIVQWPQILKYSQPVEALKFMNWYNNCAILEDRLGHDIADRIVRGFPTEQEYFAEAKQAIVHLLKEEADVGTVAAMWERKFSTPSCHAAHPRELPIWMLRCLQRLTEATLVDVFINSPTPRATTALPGGGRVVGVSQRQVDLVNCMAGDHRLMFWVASLLEQRMETLVQD